MAYRILEYVSLPGVSTDPPQGDDELLAKSVHTHVRCGDVSISRRQHRDVRGGTDGLAGNKFHLVGSLPFLRTALEDVVRR